MTKVVSMSRASYTVWQKWQDMWSVALILFAVASCNAELHRKKTTNLPTSADNRIIGGSPTTIEQYPFAVQVIIGMQFLCGGSLVTTKHVLSAAHCFVARKGPITIPVSPIHYSIRASTNILNSGGSLHLVTAIKVHELYNSKTLDNDVAVVLMAPSVNLRTSVARLALIPSQDTVVPDDSFVTAVGWGRTDMNITTPSTVLNEVTVRKINLNACQARFNSLGVERGKLVVTNSMICAGIDVGGKGTCKGDSGGPLLYKGLVVGVTSWGIDCAAPEILAVFARVANYSNWINYTVNYSLSQNGIGNSTNPCNTGSLSSKVGATTLLTSLLYLTISV